MKNQIKNKKTVKKFVIAIIAFALIIAGVLTYVYVFKGNFFGWKATQDSTKSNNTIDHGPATDEQKEAGNQVKSGSKSDTPPEPTIVPGSDKKSVQMVITAANQNGSTLQIRSLISAVVNTGACTLSLTKAGQPTITKSASTQALSSTSTCQGFDVPTSELSVGTWHILIEYNSDTLIGSATKDIVIE
jgi:hypothetical protein